METKTKKLAVSIVSPGDGKNPHAGTGTKVIDLETGQEIDLVREIHIHIVPDDVVTAEVTLFPSAVKVLGAEATLRTVDSSPPSVSRGPGRLRALWDRFNHWMSQ